jgi:DNA-binding response OmpR family regulator
VRLPVGTKQEKELAMRVLVIEDNLDIQSNIADFLEPEFVLDFAYNGDDGLNLALANDYDVIVLDLMLPKLDGLALCLAYKSDANLQAPILMLTARDTLEDKASGFAAGADDYLVKPFALRELKMRIEALARRPRVRANAIMSFEDLVLDEDQNAVACHSASEKLNNKEALILKLLMTAAPHSVPSSTISFKIWGEDPPSGGALRTHIYNLRKILSGLQSDLGCSVILETDRARGYRLTKQVSG